MVFRDEFRGQLVLEISSAISDPGVEARHLASGFFNVIQSVDDVTLGPAIYGGLATLYSEAPASIDLIDTYLLLGDPAMHLNRFYGTLNHFYLPLITRVD